MKCLTKVHGASAMVTFDVKRRKKEIIIIIIMEAFIKRRIPGKTTCSKAIYTVQQ